MPKLCNYGPKCLLRESLFPFSTFVNFVIVDYLKDYMQNGNIFLFRALILSLETLFIQTAAHFALRPRPLFAFSKKNPYIVAT